METRPSFKDFKSKALSNENVKKEYDLLEERYKIIDMIISVRKAAGLTQEEIAAALHTSKSNISRLESYNYTSSPKLSTLMEYGRTTGHKLELHFKKV